MARKLIVTSEKRLRAKYGDSGWKRIEKAVTNLISCDRARGVETTLVTIDMTLGKKGGTGKNPASVKSAVDRAFARAGRPEYLLILGGPDVVPYQDLLNPAKDDDPIVSSDLPYASEAPAASEAERFVVASRVVGRIPDMNGDGEPAGLIRLLGNAADWKPLTKKSYDSCFGLSAAEWKQSTDLSLRALFGKAAKLRTSPRDGPSWKKADLSSLTHFINCHGAPSDPQFYGQSGASYPIAHESSCLPGKVTPGTIVAAECCYGAELYAPANGASAICMTYLAQGAIGFLGSTTIAYGPADTNGSADLLCRYFLESILGGASLGRALLEARQRFAKEASPISPIDLKTLAQFYLLGDPSLHPIASKKAAKATAKGGVRSDVGSLSTPRALLESNALALSTQLESVSSTQVTTAAPKVVEAFALEARRAGLVPVSDVKTFEVRWSGGGDASALESLSASRPKGMVTNTRFHLQFAAPEYAVSSPGLDSAAPKRAGTKRVEKGKITKSVCLLAREVGGRVTVIERLWAHAGRADEERM